MESVSRVVPLSFVLVLVACRPSSPEPPPPASSGVGVAVLPEAAPPPVTDAAAPRLEADAGGSDAAVVTSSAPDGGAPEGMLWVPGGTFMMGTDAGGEGDERPAHEVTLKGFWLDRTEVTQAAYEACVTAGACKPADPDILATFGGAFRSPNKPIIGVSWYDARAYCIHLGKRLPREAEFERAVRGEDGRKFPWGNEPPTKERTVFSPSNFPKDVGTHPTGRGPYGHDDLAGNVWEWMADDYDPIAYTRPTANEGKPGTCDEIIAAQNKLRAEGREGFTGTNPIPTECEKSIRGGAYNYGAAGLRSTNRVHHHARFKLRMLGFRCAKDAG